jgi:hypothetical protein
MTPAQLSTAKLILETRLHAAKRSGPVSTRELQKTLRGIDPPIKISDPALRDLISREIVPALAEENVCLVSTQSDGYWTAIDEMDAVSVKVVAKSILKRIQTMQANEMRLTTWAAQWTKLQKVSDGE